MMNNFWSPIERVTRKSYSVVPPGWYHINGFCDANNYIKMVEWILNSDAIHHGVLACNVPGFNQGNTTREMWKTYLDSIMRAFSEDQWKPVYLYELYFAEPEDAVMFKLKFV